MALDLSTLPSPQVIESIDFEAILSARKLALLALVPEADRPAVEATLALESESLTKLLEESAYREMLLRARINDAARSVMLSFAVGADLDQIGGHYGIPRLVTDPGDETAVPPVAQTLEADADYRQRILRSLDAYPTAGSRESYRYHALSASGDVLDARPISPAPGQVTVYVLSRSGDGSADDILLKTVDAAVNDLDVRPMTDQVTVLSASIISYAISAHLLIASGPDAELVRASAASAAAAYAAARHRIGADISLSGIYQALHQPGVIRVDLASPSVNISIADGQAPWCSGITLTAEQGNG